MSPVTQSFVSVSKDSDFPIQNIPFGVFSTSDKVKRDNHFRNKKKGRKVLYGFSNMINVYIA